MTQQAGTRARDEFARLLTERGHPRDGVPWRAALDSGTLRDRFLALAFMERAAVAQPLPPEVGMPQHELPAPAPDPPLPQGVVDLFRYGAASDRPAA